MAMRNGDFSAVSQRIYDPFTGDPANGNNRTPFANNVIPQDRISPIARRLLQFVPEPNIAGAPLGQPNFQQAQTREKTTDGFDTKLNYSVSAKDQLSYRLSFMRPVVFDPGAFGEYGGPANDGFAGTGTNKSISTAVTWTRTFTNTTLLDVRGGLNYYHNVALAQGADLNTSTDVGIPGANLDDYTSGLTRFEVGGYTNPLLGFSPSLPWDRSEKTWHVATTLTQVKGTHTLKVGGEWRNNKDVLLQTQDAGGPRGRFIFNAAGTGSPAETASLTGIANSLGAFLLDWPNGVARDLKVIDEPGTKHWAIATFIHDKWQMRPNITVDLGLRWEYYDPLVGIEGQGTLANYDPATNSIRVAGYGSTTNAVNVEKWYKNWAPRTGISWRLDDRSVVRAGYGASAIPFPDNRYAFTFPVKQNYQGSVANNFQRAGTMAAGFPAPVLANIPSDGVIPATGSLLNSTFDVIPPGLHEGMLHSWNVAFQRELPYRFAADIAYVGNRGVDLVMDVDTNASMIYGSGNDGRPQFAPFNRTGDVAHAHQSRQVALPRPADEARSPLPERPDGHQLVHAQPVDGLCQREHRHRHADRLRAELGPIELRPAAQLRALDDLRTAVRPGQAVDDRHRSPAGSSAGGRSAALRGAVGHAAQHHGQRHAAEHAGQHRLREPDRRRTRCSAAWVRACCTSIRPSTRCRRPTCRAT